MIKLSGGVKILCLAVPILMAIGIVLMSILVNSASETINPFLIFFPTICAAAGAFIAGILISQNNKFGKLVPFNELKPGTTYKFDRAYYLKGADEPSILSVYDKDPNSPIYVGFLPNFLLKRAEELATFKVHSVPEAKIPEYNEVTNVEYIEK
ncbi:MAG: hypothetical protein WCV70_02595 [Patescibacteria group bacterium]|jgi:hypothetical protein